MLTDQDKARILDEETYRREVKAGLEMADSKGARWRNLWGIVNSGVVIWFLSSVVLGMGGFLYNRLYVVGRENQRAAARLDAEIASRLVYFNQMVAMRKRIAEDIARTRENAEGITKTRKNGEGTSPLDPFDMSKLVMALERPSTVDYPMNVFPEYQNRSLRSLLWELMQVVPYQEKEGIRLAYRQSVNLQYIYLNDLYSLQHLPNQPAPTLGDRAGWRLRTLLDTEEFASVFNLKRWGSPFEGGELVRKDRENKATTGEPK